MAASIASQTIPVPAQATVLIARIARVLRQRFEQVLTPLGLRCATWWRSAICGVTARPPSRRWPIGFACTPAAWSACSTSWRRTNSSYANATELIDVAGSSSSRREVSRHSPRVDEAVQIVEDEMMTGLNPTDRATLHELLARLDVGETDWGLIAAES
jgi:hypothetical protein